MSATRATKGRSRFRWILGGASAGMAITGLLTLTVGTGAGATVDPGQGDSYAQALQVTPHEGSLAVGVVLGEALAGHTEYSSRAQSLGMDLGAIGTSLKSYNCGKAPTAQQQALVPSPLEVESGAPGASQGKTTSPSYSDYGFTEHALASTVPYGEADTTLGQTLSTPAFTAAGMTTKSWSGVVNGQREAGATSDIGVLSLADGVVQLKHLDWESVYPSGGSARPTGSFNIGSALVNGQALSSQQVQNLPALQAAINKVLGVIGIELQFPQAIDAGGIETVTPLQIEVVPNTTRDTVVDGVLNAVSAPVVNPLFNGLENGFGTVPNQPWSTVGKAEPAGLVQALCESDTPITVAAVSVASLSGAGYFNAALGGVNSTSSAVPTNPYSLQALGFGNLTIPGSSQFVPGSAGTAGTLGTKGVPAVSPSGLSTPGSPASSQAQPALSNPAKSSSSPATGSQVSAEPARAKGLVGTTGGALLAAGLGGLGLLGLLAEGDRRMMRRAQHTVTFEE